MIDWAVEIAFNAGPKDALSAATWTDITDFVVEVDIDRGRQRQLNRIQAGTLIVRLEDTDGRFNPANTASPYWPDVKPNRRIRVTGDAGAYSDTYTDDYEGMEVLFSGFVDRWPQAWPESEFVPVTIEASDGFKILASKDLPSSVYAWEVERDDPSHWWRLGESSGTTAVDNGELARRYDGTYVGSPVLNAPSLVEHDSNTGVDFDGIDDEVQIGGDALPKQATQAAAEIVFRPDSLPASGQRMALVVGPENTANSTNAWLSLLIRDDGSLDFVFRIDGGAYLFSGRVETAFSPGNIYHLLLVIDADVGADSVFINGVDQTVTSTTSLDATQTGLMLLGGTDGVGDEFGTVQHFDGIISEFVLYENDLGWFGAVEIDTSRIEAHANAVDVPWNGDTSGERVGRVLNIAGWPTADRDLDTGQTTFADANFNDDETVLDYLHRCAESENGLFFIDRNGDARFIERHASITDVAYSESQATFSDSPGAGEYNYEAFEPDYDDQLVNIATFQRKFGVTQSAEDAASRAAYGDAELTRTALLMATDVEAKSAAEWVVTHNAEPRMEVRRIAVHPELDPAVWPKALMLDLLERVTVERAPKHGGDAFIQEASIQGVSHRIRPTDSGPGWVTGWWLSPVDSQAYWILGDTTYSVLGSTTRLAY